MKAFEYLFREGLTKGLRRFATHPRNEQGLIECYNAIPSEGGLKPYSALTITTITGGGGTWTIDFPWPQIKFLERYNLAFTKTGASTVGWFELTWSSGVTDWTATLMKNLSFEPLQIEVAASGTFYTIAFYDGSNTKAYLRYPSGTVEEAWLS